LVRDETGAVLARQRGAAEAFIGDLRDRRSLAQAAQGASGVFHIGPAFVADEAELGLNLIDAAERAGVRRFVFSGVIHPTNNRLKNHTVKQPVENALFASRLQYTILHPTTLMQNIAAGWPAVLETGVFAEPYSNAARIARVDYRDVAEVAAIALTEDRLAYGTFELCADGMADRKEIASMMSEALGRRIEARELSFEEWEQRAKLPYDAQRKALLKKVYEYYSAYGSAGNSLVLNSILGRAPRTLHAFIEELAGSAASRQGQHAAATRAVPAVVK
jgi:uncharacterized protein YbjT (DUF2867 family)